MTLFVSSLARNPAAPLRPSPLVAGCLNFACHHIAGLGFGPCACAGDATYSADEVSKHFKQLKTRSLKPAGGTRALCIGTRDECNPNAKPNEGGQVAVSQDGAKSDGGETEQDPCRRPGDQRHRRCLQPAGFPLEYASARLSTSAQANLREFRQGASTTRTWPKPPSSSKATTDGNRFNLLQPAPVRRPGPGCHTVPGQPRGQPGSSENRCLRVKHDQRLPTSTTRPTAASRASSCLNSNLPHIQKSRAGKLSGPGLLKL